MFEAHLNGAVGRRWSAEHVGRAPLAAAGDLGVALNETMVFEKAWVRVTWVVPELVEWGGQPVNEESQLVIDQRWVLAESVSGLEHLAQSESMFALANGIPTRTTRRSCLSGARPGRVRRAVSAPRVLRGRQL